jgi:hypothetical protein
MNNELKLKRILAEVQEEPYWLSLVEQWENEGIDIDNNIALEKSDKHQHYTIHVKDKIYELSWDLMLLGNKKSAVEVNFKLKNLKDFKNSNFDTGITGTGDVMEVFNKIISTIVTLAERDKVDYITFLAREEKRQKTYRFIIRKLLQKINYKSIDISPLTNSTFDEDEFWLERV